MGGASIGGSGLGGGGRHKCIFKPQLKPVSGGAFGGDDGDAHITRMASAAIASMTGDRRGSQLQTAAGAAGVHNTALARGSIHGRTLTFSGAEEPSAKVEGQ